MPRPKKALQPDTLADGMALALTGTPADTSDWVDLDAMYEEQTITALLEDRVATPCNGFAVCFCGGVIELFEQTQRWLHRDTDLYACPPGVDEFLPES